MTDNSKNVEEKYKKFVRCLYRYLSEPIKNFSLIKPKILELFKTHRPIKVADYQYGISKAGKNKSQLIVHELNERAKVREYFKTGKNVWFCCECNRTASKTNDHSIVIGDLVIAHGILFVKLELICEPRQLSFVLQIQKLYKE
uniref:Uncharacterized protein n=1 Tax=Panagrolaimus sp. ES5 TaxID=591445 RepID=A0AC34G352_9BILA